MKSTHYLLKCSCHSSLDIPHIPHIPQLQSNMCAERHVLWPEEVIISTLQMNVIAYSYYQRTIKFSIFEHNLEVKFDT